MMLHDLCTFESWFVFSLQLHFSWIPNKNEQLSYRGEFPLRVQKQPQLDFWNKNISSHILRNCDSSKTPSFSYALFKHPELRKRKTQTGYWPISSTYPLKHFTLRAPAACFLVVRCLWEGSRQDSCRAHCVQWPRDVGSHIPLTRVGVVFTFSAVSASGNCPARL